MKYYTMQGESITRDEIELLPGSQYILAEVPVTCLEDIYVEVDAASLATFIDIYQDKMIYGMDKPYRVEYSFQQDADTPLIDGYTLNTVFIDIEQVDAIEGLYILSKYLYMNRDDEATRSIKIYIGDNDTPIQHYMSTVDKTNDSLHRKFMHLGNGVYQKDHYKRNPYYVLGKAMTLKVTKARYESPTKLDQKPIATRSYVVTIHGYCNIINYLNRLALDIYFGINMPSHLKLEDSVSEFICSGLKLKLITTDGYEYITNETYYNLGLIGPGYNLATPVITMRCSLVRSYEKILHKLQKTKCYRKE